jgi:hypothetical protein
MGFIQHEALFALEESGGDMEASIEMLTSGQLNLSLPQLDDNVAIQTENFFYNLLFYVRDRLQNMTNYCYICYERHLDESIRLRACNKEICEFRFEEVSGLSVYAELVTNFDMVMLDLSYAAEAAFS